MGKRGIIAHYGEDRKVILALDNAGTHPEGLRSDQIVVKFPIDYVKEYNGIYNRNEDWDGIIFRGFSLINAPPGCYS